ncbi:MAG: stress responsive protein [Blastopirellula sp.]|nr:MAG: stress responsive protein [Blastopirellula sp.]
MSDTPRVHINHDVFFTLKDSSSEAIDKLVAACHEYLTGHPGCVFFSAGHLTSELTREVNDQEFHVALHVVFDSLETQNQYQVADRHNQFIAENKESWAKVRVFDSTVSVG